MIQFSPEERQVWKELVSVDENTIQVQTDKLFSIRESGIQLSSLSVELLSIESIPEQLEFVNQSKGQALQHQNFITCLGKHQKSFDEDKTVTMLVIGTENRDILLLDQTGMQIKKQIQLKSVPVQIQCHGQFEVESKIYVACRDGKIYLLKQFELMESPVYSIESKPVAFIRLEKQIVIAGMNSTLNSFYLKGKKNFSITMPASITNLEKMELKRNQSIQCSMVALSNGEIRIYNDKHLIHILKNEVRQSLFISYG